MRVQVFFLFTILSVLSLTSGKSPSQYFCGRRLANTLAIFCSYGDIDKRSDFKYQSPDLKHNEIDTEDPENSLDSIESLLNSAGITGLIDNGAGSPEVMADKKWGGKLGGSRHKRGVVSECCDQPCTLDELLTYC